MADGTYADESPDASIGERLANSVRKIIGLPKDPTQTDVRNAADSGNTAQESADARVGRMKQAQSTDRDNSYSY